MKRNLILFLITFCLFSITEAQTSQLAFPGAEGFGKYAVGGRYGSVYRVTNLNDSGTGSLRDAVSSSNRIIVFEVAGVININSPLVFSNNLYIAGQTAPGEGIVIYGDRSSFSGASNTIVRHIRFRMGKGGASGADAVGIANGTHMIFDHVSVAWGLDETFSISPDNKGALGNITIQNSIIGQGLLSHSAGGLIQADNITLYRNLYVDNSTRNPKVKGKNQYVNNIVYNWKNAAYIMGGESTGDAYCNAVSNLFIKGPSGGSVAFSGGNSLFHLYAADNWVDKTADGNLSPYLIPNAEYSGGPDFQAQPYDYPQLPTWTANQLVDSLLPVVGASLPYRDLADWYMVNEVRSFGLEGKLISEENQLPIGIPSSWTFWSGIARADRDQDGMPDAWEIANQCNPDVNDAMTIADNGYANIENYINSIDVEDRQAFLRAPVAVSLQVSTPSSLTIAWLDYTEGEEGFVVEAKTDADYVVMAQVEAGVQSVTLNDLQPATAYTIRIKSFHSERSSEYTSEQTFKTQPEEVPVIDPNAYVPDLTWSAESGIWDYAQLNWNDGSKAFQKGDSLLFQPLSDIQVQLNDSLEIGALVVKDDGNVAFTGTGVLTGNGSVNKAGASTLSLGDQHVYTGASVLSEGTWMLSSLRDGGLSSSLGASQEFAQNWIWKGGIWNYTGATTATNRNATLYGASTFAIANPATTVTLNGALEGTGGMILDGAGTLRINQAFAYEGNTVLKGGTLYIEGANLIDQGIGTSPKLVMAGGSFKTKDSNDRYGVYSFPIEVLEGTYSTLYVHRNCSIKSKVSGSGTLEYQVNYLREYVTGDWRDFTGHLVVNGVNSKAGECQFMLLNGNGIPNATLYTKGNVQIVCWSTSATYYLGGLSGDPYTYLSGSSKNTTSAQMKWVVGGANTDETFRGIIDNRCSASSYNGTTSIVKTGEGLWRLTGINVYKGTTEVQQGKLIVNGNHTGSGAVTVSNGAELAGEGSLSGRVTLLDGALLRAGDTIVDNKMLNLRGGLTLSSTSVTQIPLLKSSPITRKANQIVVNGTAVLNGTLQLNLDQISYPLQKNNYFDVFDFSNASVTGTFSDISPATPGEGLIWDLTSLYTDGRIYVREEGWVSVPQIGLEDTDVYPTMVTDHLSVQLPSNVAEARVDVLDLTGVAHIQTAISGSASINTSDLASGMYILRLSQSNGKTVTRKIMKQ
ncbi:MAG: T9SS type A sorting domain-containing protein [Bacteroidales bacterium]